MSLKQKSHLIELSEGTQVMDATVTRFIAASPERVASVMFDPSHDPEWIGGAKSVEWVLGDPTAVGAKVTRYGGFMGGKFSWQTEVESFIANRCLQMRFIAGPMKGGDVTYRIDPDGKGSRVSVKNTGPGSGLISWFVKRSVRKDLERLAKLVETAP